MQSGAQPNVLKYAFGFSFLLSVGFNMYMFAAYEGGQRQHQYPPRALAKTTQVDCLALQEQLQACHLNTLDKDSIIRVLEQVAHKSATQHQP